MATEKLTRSRTDRKLAGVCGGVAAHFDMDSTLVRILWAVAVIAGFGTGFVIYVILWIALPEDDGMPVPAASPAIHVAEERYARGEITAEELARIREGLAR